MPINIPTGLIISKLSTLGQSNEANDPVPPLFRIQSFVRSPTAVPQPRMVRFARHTDLAALPTHMQNLIVQKFSEADQRAARGEAMAAKSQLDAGPAGARRGYPATPATPAESGIGSGTREAEAAGDGEGTQGQEPSKELENEEPILADSEAS